MTIAQTPPPVGGPALSVRDLAKSFGAVRALKTASLDLMPGEVHALMGENGAGKSTLIKIITGAETPDRGELVVNGHVVPSMDPGRSRARAAPARTPVAAPLCWARPPAFDPRPGVLKACRTVSGTHGRRRTGVPRSAVA